MHSKLLPMGQLSEHDHMVFRDGGERPEYRSLMWRYVLLPITIFGILVISTLTIRTATTEHAPLDYGKYPLPF